MSSSGDRLNIIDKIKIALTKRFVLLYFTSLFILMMWVYFPYFFHPPRSDAWSLLYCFHHLDDYPGGKGWLHVLNFDPFTQMRFYPLAFIFHYLSHTFLGANYIYCQHIFHFSLHFIAIVLLYNLGSNFCKDKMLLMAFIAILPFLFSHFDIIVWSFHVYIIFGFCSLLFGFILYIRYLKSGRKIFLGLTPLFLLAGMLTYESFAFWPLAIIILSYLEDTKGEFKFKRRQKEVSYLLAIGVVYFIYIVIFFLTRSIGTYEAVVLEWRGLLSAKPLTVFASGFNTLYNGIIVNIFPKVALPFSEAIEDNINMGGFIETVDGNFNNYFLFRDNGKFIFIIGGSLFFYTLLRLVEYLFKIRKSRVVKIMMFFLFLMLSELLLVFHLRTFTNTYTYDMRQFRYQYISNAFIILMAAYLLENLLKPSRIKKITVYGFLVFMFLSNIFFTRQSVLYVNKELSPLKDIISSIRSGIREGTINSTQKLYINDAIAGNLPRFCWNRQMGSQFMKGTYQWLFNKKEINYFASRPEEAYWVITRIICGEKSYWIITNKANSKSIRIL